MNVKIWKKKISTPQRTFSIFRRKIISGEIDKRMNDAQFLFYDEFKDSEDGKLFARKDCLERDIRGLFMMSSFSFIPYILVDTTLSYTDGTPEDAIKWLDKILLHELCHQLCPSERTWDELLASKVETFLIGERDYKEIPIIEVD